MPVVVVFSVAVGSGLVVGLLARRWPRLDIAAPKVDVASPVVREQVRKHPGLRSLLRREIDPATATGLVLTVTTAILLVGVVAVGLLLLMVHSDSGLARWDLSFARWGGDNATTTSTRLLRDISLFGGTLGVVSCSVVVGLLEYRRRPNRAIPWLILLTVGGQFALVNVIKVIVNRDRPNIRQLTGFSSQSFPSGHAAAAAAAFAMLALLLGRGRPRSVRNALAGVAVGLAVLVAGSRVMLGVHWFTDVLAGVAVGWAWLAACSVAFGGRLLHFGQPVEAAAKVAATPAADTSGERSPS
jgi:membrane-associated phospholipid phosphatase